MVDSVGPHSDFTVGRQRETVRVVINVPGFYWRCESCGWLGTGFTAIEGAMNEGAEHAVDVHGLPAPIVQRVDWGLPDGPIRAPRFADGDNPLEESPAGSVSPQTQEPQ